MLTDERGAPRGDQNDIVSTVWTAFEEQVLSFFYPVRSISLISLEIGVINK